MVQLEIYQRQGDMTSYYKVKRKLFTKHFRNIVELSKLFRNMGANEMLVYPNGMRVARRDVLSLLQQLLAEFDLSYSNQPDIYKNTMKHRISTIIKNNLIGVFQENDDIEFENIFIDLQSVD